MKRRWRIAVIALSAMLGVGMLAIGLTIAGAGDLDILTMIQKGKLFPSLAIIVQWLWPAEDLYGELGRDGIRLQPGESISLSVVHRYLGSHAVSLLYGAPGSSCDDEWLGMVVAVTLQGRVREEVIFEPPQAGCYRSCEGPGVMFYWYEAGIDDVDTPMRVLVEVIEAGQMDGTEAEVVVDKIQSY